MVFSDILRNGVYPISVSWSASSSHRHHQAAKSFGADCVAHGSTGAGNDQVLRPDVWVLRRNRDHHPDARYDLTREYEIDYLKKHGRSRLQEDGVLDQQGLWGTSIGGKETLHSSRRCPKRPIEPDHRIGRGALKITFGRAKSPP